MAQSPLDDRVVAVKDFESLARDNVAPHIWNYLSDGAGDQQALLENEVAWQEPWFAPKVMTGVTKVTRTRMMTKVAILTRTMTTEKKGGV